MSELKIAVLGTRGYPSFYGGFETAVRHLIEESTQKNFKYYVFSRKNNCLRDPNRKNAIVLYTPNLKSIKLATLSHIFFSFPKILITKPDVILAFNVSCGYVFPLARIFRIPTILNVDGLEWKRSKWGSIAKSVYFIAAKMSAKFADHIICDSTEIATYWKRVFGRESTYIAYGGSQITSNKLLRPGLSEYLLYVARFVPENHFEEFLESLNFLDKDIPVIIVGSANGNEYFEKLLEIAIRSRKNVKYLGHLSDDNLLNQLWSNCGLYFHGHSVGGTNPALVQSMACSAPIIAFDSVYNREVLQDCGIYTSGQPQEMANLINEFFKSPSKRRRLGLNAKNRASIHFNWVDVVKKYEHLISRAIL